LTTALYWLSPEFCLGAALVLVLSLEPKSVSLEERSTALSSCCEKDFAELLDRVELENRATAASAG
jgi:hypothetical protein